MKVAGNLFLPKNMKEGDRYPAIIVGHPMEMCIRDRFLYNVRSDEDYD